MSTTTPNFGWTIPSDTDLVTDGAAAMRDLGDGIDTSFVDLNGGTTGQILSKTSATDLDFTWITNDVGDITGVTAGTGLSGGGTSGAVTVSIDTATTVDKTTAQTLTNKTLTSPVITNELATTIRETITISATAATGTIAYDAITQSILYYTTDASGNFTVNFRGNSGISMNTLMATGESLSATFLVTNGATAYYNSVVQVDGSTVTPKWQGGTAPTSGNASSIDSYTYVIIKTGSAAFTVLASVTKFA